MHQRPAGAGGPGDDRAGVASLPTPYSPSDKVAAVDHLFRHARGDESRPPPLGLEVFPTAAHPPHA